MGINLSTPKVPTELKPRIMVFGVGGAGGNAVNNMIRSNLEGVECVVANTDAQALAQSLAERKIQLGLSITQGLGAGSRPEIGKAAAEEGLEEIVDHLQGCHMAFVTAGMGGGTGTGAAPVIAKLAREAGVLTVAVITKPFQFEGAQRMRIAEDGIAELQDQVDTLIVIPNQNLFRVADENTTFADAFKLADEVLYAGVRGVTDLMTMPGLINLDFADIRTVMGEMGKAMMGAGEAEGDGRSVKAAESAIANPLLDDVSLRGARGVLINITGGNDMTLYEVDEAANRIREEVDPEANIIFGSTFDEGLQGRVRVSIFATGINGNAALQPQPLRLRMQDDVARRVSRPAITPTPTPTPTPTIDRDRDEGSGDRTTEAVPGAEPDDDAPPAAEARPAAAATPHVAPQRREPTFEGPPDEAPEPVSITNVTALSDDDEAEAADTRPIVREVPAPADHKPRRAKPRSKGRSRLLGLLIDNSAPADEEPESEAAEDGAQSAARGAEPPAAERRGVEEPEAPEAVGEATEPPPKIAAEPEPAQAEERAEAELLEIPAFLRRQAN